MKKRRAVDKDLGQGMVEFALVVPLLLLLLLGIFELGRVLFTYSAVVSASREAARYGAAILDTGGGIPQYEDCTGIREAAKRIGKFAGVTDANITIQYSNDSGIYSTSCPPAQEVMAADTISISIDTIVQPISPVGHIPAIPISSSSSRTILKNVKMGFSGTGAGSVSGALTDVNFQTTYQKVEETQGTIAVTLVLNETASDVVTIPFSVTGTALQGSGQDYVMTASPVIINPGQKTTTIYITLNNDGIDEGDETIILGIDNPINATKGPQNIHTITVTDAPKISFTTTSSVKSESDPGTAVMIELSKGSTQDVSVSFHYSGSATWGSSGDYLTAPATVVIPTGSLSAMLLVDIKDDIIDEENEVAHITLDLPVNAIVGPNATHSLTILDDDDPPQITFDVAKQWVSEEIGYFATTLELSEVSGKVIQVPFTTSGAATGGDVNIHQASPLIIPAGSKTAEISMDIFEGDGMEEDEDLIITLGAPNNATLGGIPEQTIVITETSTEPKVTFASGGITVIEGGYLIPVSVRLSNAWSSPVEVSFVVSGTALAGSDFVSPVSPLVIPVGRALGTINVVIKDDTMDENLETIQLDMGTILNGLPGDITTHTINIVDDDDPPEVSITSLNQNATEDSGSVSVTLELNATSVNTISVPLNIAGSATNGVDYTVSTTTVMIPPGTKIAAFQISILDDLQYDPNENVIVTLGFPTNADLGSPISYILSIEDNELAPCQVGVNLLTVGMDSISLSIVNEGESIVLTGGSVSWQPIDPNQPRLTDINFAGTAVFAGSEKPPSYWYSASVDFYTLATEVLTFQFDGPLGTGEHVLVSNFQNPVDGTTCSLTEIFNKH